ncbi:putative ABC transport system ATP-binding protein [Ruaniaceae bacterium KH17]|nr:putative ABC transport system ATP-binding protein [Ruaniaceae bacterium KH17]
MNEVRTRRGGATTVTQSQVLLELVDVSKTYRNGPEVLTALHPMSLRIDPGELVVIMGPSGSGKSTLLGIAGGLIQPDSGTVTVDGSPVTGVDVDQVAKVRRQKVGYVFQDFNLISSFSAIENVVVPLELEGMGRSRRQKAAIGALSSMGVADVASRLPDEMSGGQQQRVAIARALVGSRRLLLADEPTGALDSTNGEAIIHEIRRRVDRGAGALVVTHDPRYRAFADRLYGMSDGVLKAVG